jgi:hypothetical protein
LTDTITFEEHTQNCLNSLPDEVKDSSIPLSERKLKALIHLNTTIHPHLNNNDTGMLLDILRMKEGFEKLRLVMLWNIAVKHHTNDIHKIIELMDKYIERSVS